MQVTETLSQGLKREYAVVLPAADLASRLEGQLVEIRAKARINGFRPGKAPLSFLKKMYGRSVMAEVVQEAVNEAHRKIVEDNSLRPASQPKIDFGGEKEDLEKAFEAQGDFAFTVALEVLPRIEVGGFEDIEIERLVAQVGDAEIDAALNRLADQARPFEPKAEGAAAEKGDKATIDFVGRLEGEVFEGGSGEGVDLVLGSGGFIPGFEEQVEGLKVGETKTVAVTFPQDYSAAHLAGKPAEFEVTLKALAAPGALAVDDEFAKGYGFENLDGLKSSIRASIERDYAGASRRKWKRALLDALDKRYAFDLPEALVSQEFDAIWRQVEAEQARTGASFEDEGTTQEAAKADYRKIAERRVRLGLLLADVGDAAGVKVEDQEVNQALVERLRSFPGQEQMIWDFYRKNPAALAEIRAPLYEEKVVDHILTRIKVTDKTVPKEELLAPEPDEDEIPAASKSAEPAAQEG
ncbi:trigger factor [Methylocella sp.]|uniref:trigger factor n=1 Tax=Methylocella sp. TaxID=1978226 RepID=UPI0037841A60